MPAPPSTVNYSLDALRIAGLTLIYGSLAQMVLAFTLTNGNVTMLWLPGGIGLAALLIGGKKLWPGIFLGATIAGFMMSDPVWVSLSIAAGNTLETLAAYCLLSRFQAFSPELKGPLDLLSLTLAALPSCLISALIGPTVLVAAGILAPESILKDVLNWWQGDCIGILLGTPLILIWRRKPQGWLRPARLAETLCFFGLSFLAGQIIFMDWFHASLGKISMGYWLYLFMTWAALRYGRHGVTLVAALASTQAFEGARRGQGVFGHDLADTGLQNFWFYFLVLTAIGLLLTLTLEARKRTEQELQAKSRDLAESESRFRNLATIAPVGIYCTDPAGNFLFVNDTWRALTGFSGTSALGVSWDALIFGEDRERVSRERRLAFAANQAFGAEYRINTSTGEPREVLGSGLAQYDENGVLQGYIGALTDITERKRLEKGMKDADRRKDEFLAMLAHELRNPLAPIRNAVHILQESGPDSARLFWCCDIIHRQISHLTGLVDDLLDVSRISRGLIQLNKEVLEVWDIIHLALESSQPLIDARRQELNLDLADGRIWVEGDRIRLSQVISNLINNAVKFSDAGGRIDLSAKHAGDWVCIRVRDNGCGFKPADLPNMFEMFYQGERNLDRSEGGLGVGLSIVRNLVGMHGGEVWAHSRGLGLGSEFEVRLPRAIPLATRPAPSLEPAAEARGKPRILVVDDNRDVADSTALVLRTHGHEVLTAYDGPSALEMAMAGKPDVFLLDIGLPGMDGYEVARAIRANSDFKGSQLIAITGYGQPKDREMAFAAGFDEHLVKPFNFKVLQKLIDDHPRVSV